MLSFETSVIYEQRPRDPGFQRRYYQLIFPSLRHPPSHPPVLSLLHFSQLHLITWPTHFHLAALFDQFVPSRVSWRPSADVLLMSDGLFFSTQECASILASGVREGSRV